MFKKGLEVPHAVLTADLALRAGRIGATLDKPEVLPGFELRLMTDAKRYLVTITDTTDPCRFSFVSDERGLIVQGEAIR